MSANWITRNVDTESVVMDAICLAEAVWWGCGEQAYKGWSHGIYAWRQLCLDVAPWLHSAWQKAEELSGGEDTVTFDCEFCEELAVFLLKANSDQFDPYMLQRFVHETYGSAEAELRRLCEDPNSRSDELRLAIIRFMEECK